jgi:hypothetical protein
MEVKKIINFTIMALSLILIYVVMSTLGMKSAAGLIVVLPVLGIVFFRRSLLITFLLCAATIMFQDPIFLQPITYALLLLYILRWVHRETSARECIMPMPKEYFLLLLYGIVVLYTGVYRGFLRGGSFIGETMYIWSIIIPIGLMAIARSRNIFSEKKLKRNIILCLLFASLPLVLEILISKGVYKFNSLLYFINLPIGRLVSNASYSDYSMRYRSGYLFSMMLASIALLLPYYAKGKVRKNLLFTIMILLAAYVVFLTGYRKNMAGLFILLAGGSWLLSSNRGALIIKML